MKSGFQALLIMLLCLLVRPGFAQVYDDSVWEKLADAYYKLHNHPPKGEAQLERANLKLVDLVEKHLEKNGVLFSRDEKNVISIDHAKPNPKYQYHAINHLAYKLYSKFNRLRLIIDPLKMIRTEASASFEENSNSLYMDVESVLNISTSHYLGHELIHAKYYSVTKSSIDHAYLGWLSPSDEYSLSESGYEEGFFFDELPAYYYESILLFRNLVKARGDERKRLKEQLKVVLKIGHDLASHFTSGEISGQMSDILSRQDLERIKFAKDGAHDLVKVRTETYIINYLITKGRFATDAQKIKEVLRRHKLLIERAGLIEEAFTKALTALAKNHLTELGASLSSVRDVALSR